MNELKRNCAGLARRDFIQLGLGATIGLSFTNLLRLRAQGATASGKVRPDQVNCIMVWLDGGPSHYETFDPKPDAPSEIRGEFKAISTSVPGVRSEEHTSELQSPCNLVCRLLLEKKKKKKTKM